MSADKKVASDVPPRYLFYIILNSNLAALDERNRQELSEMNSFQPRLHGFEMIMD